MTKPKLEADLGYQLQMAALTSGYHARAALADLDLTPARATALFHISEHPGCDQTELANRLLVNRANGMKVANSLADQGLIERAEGRDRRSRGLSLTRVGERTLHAALQRLAQAGDRTCVGLNATERRTLLTLLSKLNTAAIVEALPDAVAPQA